MLKVEAERLRAKIKSAKIDLETEQSRHANAIFHAEELMRELNTLREQYSELNEQK